MTVGQIASSVMQGTESVQSAKFKNENKTFLNLISETRRLGRTDPAESESSPAKAEHPSVKTESSYAKTGISSNMIAENGRINGDWRSGFSGLYTSESDKNSLPVGAAANSSSYSADKKIDRTSKLYEKSLELESYFVKILVSSMRKTVLKSGGESSYAQSMYEDMMYDEYTTSLTKHAHFGLADQIYMELV
ncbi:rod-binding protein [Treponema parvum]|uniref:Rod-binding protein n=1 Tax=Treponema parvum TaxID=138851 RepID=A0A975F3N1_9SPIR|nr:rod-binding protein [Treponema parvum]QTQ13897.1 rod-binding protein [Treponema parvum]